MDIHKPKPWHGLREFLKEYLIIVVGIATALGGESVVEALHWRHVAHDARDGLAPGFVRLLQEASEREAESVCLAREFRMLKGVLDHAGETGRLESVAVVRSPVRHAYTFNYYDTFVSGQILPHLSVDDRTVLITINGWSQYLQRNRDIEVRDWSVLRDLEGPGRRIGDAEIGNLRATLSDAIYQGGLVRGASRALAQQIATANVLSTAQVKKVWSDAATLGSRSGACAQGTESSGEILLRQYETPMNPPPAADFDPPNWPGRVG